MPFTIPESPVVHVLRYFYPIIVFFSTISRRLDGLGCKCARSIRDVAMFRPGGLFARAGNPTLRELVLVHLRSVDASIGIGCARGRAPRTVLNQLDLALSRRSHVSQDLVVTPDSEKEPFYHGG